MTRKVDFRTVDGPERDAHFSTGNDALWGVGNWVKCYERQCQDDRGMPSFHHKDHHS